MELRSIRNVKVRGKRVLVRAELNVARDRSGRIVDDSRLRAVVPTLKLLLRQRAKVIIATHLGRPNGRVVPSLRTATLAQPLRRAVQATVRAVSTSIGRAVEESVERMKPGTALLLENVRFNRGEEGNSPSLARSLARLADLFVLECFGTAHRAHASVVGLARYLPTFAGLRFVEEVRVLSRVLQHPRRPLVIMLGGSKISTKIKFITRLLPGVEALLLGGALANTVLKAQGMQIGTSYIEPKMERLVASLKLTNPKLHLPVDVVVKREYGPTRVRAAGAVHRNESILDIGPDTVDLFSDVVRSAGMIVWNGPMGKYEERPFDRGTKAVALSVAESAAYTIVGGGETVDAVRSQGLENKINFISTGGGAMIEFLEGRKLPAVELIRRKQ